MGRADIIVSPVERGGTFLVIAVGSINGTGSIGWRFPLNPTTG